MFITFIFFIYSTLLWGAMNILFSKNTIYSLISLNIIFISVSVLMFNVGVDYIPLLLIIIYVGALSILFIFVIMMLNIKIYSTKDYKLFYIFFFIFLAVLFRIKLFHDNDLSYEIYDIPFYFTRKVDYASIIVWIGRLLFSSYSIYVLLASLVLFVAMIGSVSLVFDQNQESYSRNMYQQLSRRPEKAYFMVVKKKKE